MLTVGFALTALSFNHVPDAVPAGVSLQKKVFHSKIVETYP
jgi:hypothetical protein